MELGRKAIVAVVAALSSVVMADCYTTNCTGADITGRRSCYLCCADKCVGNGELDCQESCDDKWTLVAAEYIPRDILEFVIGTKGDAQAQMDFLTDVQMWDWLVAIDGYDAKFHVAEIADWFFQNAADVRVARMAMVTLAWMMTEHDIGARAESLVEVVFVDGLESDDAKVRRSSLVSLCDIRAHRTNPAVRVQMVRVALQDPDASVREMAMKILAEY